MVRSHRLTAAAVALGLLLAGCAASDAPAAGPSAAAGSATTGPVAAPPPARQGREAPGGRTTFVPTTLVLADGTRAPVDPAATRDGVLEVPERVDRVGWWDGSARIGDPYGSTVVAGHVDSAAQGLGVLAGLLSAAPGDVVTVEGDGGSARYRVASVEAVPKASLATSGDALAQDGAHRLVLITCTGRFDPVRRSYDDNLVVTALPADA